MRSATFRAHDMGLESMARHALDRALELLVTWHERSRQRSHLLELDGSLLDDIGLNRGDAIGEAMKPFWRR